ncbi:Uncharacterised protein [uncultured archaeon]|nr:Uncharacterised protein [uncultured archaeon]
MSEKKPKRQIIAIDFDGTVCKYPRFVSPGNIPFEPIDGAKEALETIHKYFRIVIFSVRANNETGKKAIIDWMTENQIPFDDVTDRKPHSVLYIDDNAIRFEGDWKKTLKDISEVQHYSKSKK